MTTRTGVFVCHCGVNIAGTVDVKWTTEQLARHHLDLLEVNRPFERWMVLGRTGGDAPRIAFADLGLAADGRYLVFEFWSRRWLGDLTGAFVPGDMDPRFHAQLFCVRRGLDHPQVVATNRHVSCGGQDLVDVTWGGATLSGVSDLVAGDEYVLLLREPPGYRFRDVRAEGAEVVGSAVSSGLREVRLLTPSGGRASRDLWNPSSMRRRNAETSTT